MSPLSTVSFVRAFQMNLSNWCVELKRRTTSTSLWIYHDDQIDDRELIELSKMAQQYNASYNSVENDVPKWFDFGKYPGMH